MIASSGPFAVETTIRRQAPPTRGLVPPYELAQGHWSGGPLGSMIRGQTKEGQGRPDDANGRHWGSFEIIQNKI